MKKQDIIRSKGLEALRLWAEWFEKNGSPICAGECGGDLYCFFCGEFSLGSEEKEQRHTSDCIYMRAKKLLEEG